MFDIRKVQEKVIYEAVKAESDTDVAGEAIYGCGRTVHTENNPNWVKSAMRRKPRLLVYSVKTVNSFCNSIFVPVLCLRKWIN